MDSTDRERYQITFDPPQESPAYNNNYFWLGSVRSLLHEGSVKSNKYLSLEEYLKFVQKGMILLPKCARRMVSLLVLYIDYNHQLNFNGFHRSREISNYVLTPAGVSCL
jgi:hypothetical protein